MIKEEVVKKVRHEGMTLRQWYAGMALTGIMSNPEEVKDCCNSINDGSADGIWSDEVARVAFKLADAMLSMGSRNSLHLRSRR
jgi:hypothetical protein